MIAAGEAAFERAWALKGASTCNATRDQCFAVGNPSRANVGTDAGWFFGELYGTHAGSTGCFVFVFRDGAGWHFAGGSCAQGTGYIPGPQDRVYVTSGSCARVRDKPSLSGTVLDCLQRGTVVDVDSPPTYADGHIWWHLEGRGWMAHDFLLWPKGVEN